jgi:hypothetical protein
MTRTVQSFLPFILVGLAACGPEKVVAPAALPVGWYTEPTWTGSCYVPPDFEKMESTDRKIARQQTLEAIHDQWLGGRKDGIAFKPQMIDDVETTLLGRPDDIENVSRKNLELCKQVMGAGGSKVEWETWLRKLPAQLTAGECNTPVDYQLFQYLDINTGWQQPIHFCRGNKVIIEATEKDMYRIVEGGPWISAEGDLSQKATAKELPCNFEGCYVGQLIGRYVTDSGIQTVFPIGLRKDFEAPEHGTLTWQINDTVWYDNVWRKQGTIIDKTAISVTPAE